MKRVYISGKITDIETGLPMPQARYSFEVAEAMLQAHGYETVNPFDNGVDKDASWEHHMEADMKMLRTCDTIYQMNNWRDSRGAKLEYKEARREGLEIMRYTNGELKIHKW